MIVLSRVAVTFRRIRLDPGSVPIDGKHRVTSDARFLTVSEIGEDICRREQMFTLYCRAGRCRIWLNSGDIGFATNRLNSIEIDQKRWQW